MRRGSKGKRGRHGERRRSRPGRDGGTEGGPGGEAETEGLGGAGGVEQDREIDGDGRDAGDNRERAREKIKRDGDRNTEADLMKTKHGHGRCRGTQAATLFPGARKGVLSFNDAPGPKLPALPGRELRGGAELGWMEILGNPGVGAASAGGTASVGVTWDPWTANIPPVPSQSPRRPMLAPGRPRASVTRDPCRAQSLPPRPN